MFMFCFYIKLDYTHTKHTLVHNTDNWYSSHHRRSYQINEGHIEAEVRDAVAQVPENDLGSCLNVLKCAALRTLSGRGFRFRVFFRISSSPALQLVVVTLGRGGWVLRIWGGGWWVLRV